MNLNKNLKENISLRIYNFRSNRKKLIKSDFIELSLYCILFQTQNI